MREFDLEIVTPDGLAFEGKAESLLLRTDDGDVQILAGHVDYMASVGTGRVKIVTGGEERLAAASGGFVTVSGGAVRLVAVTFEFKESIDLERARQAQAKAEELIKSASDDKALLIARAKLARAASRISVASSK